MPSSRSDSVLTELTAIVGRDRVLVDPESCLFYGRDWTRFYPPDPLAVVLPDRIEQVQDLVRCANEHRLALVPSGGRTGLSGAAVAATGEVVVSFERMHRILDFNPAEPSVTCEPGVVTAMLQDYACARKLFYPVDFAARGSSQIGGNIATNAGGIKVIRYGLTRNWVTGLKVVTGRGDLLELNKGLIKNASGYDLRHLFIGSEGTLGFIVEATLLLTQPPPELGVMLLGTAGLDDVMTVFDVFRSRLVLTAFEFFSEQALRHVLHKGLQRPFATQAPYYLLIEFEQSSPAVQDVALDLFSQCSERGWVVDGVLSQSGSQARDLWRLREDITESIAIYQPYKNDISVRISEVPAFLSDIDTLLARAYPDFEVIWFGHIGDGNLHLGILKPDDLAVQDFLEKCRSVNDLLFATLAQHGGSISAEHGVGLLKKPYLYYTHTAVEVGYLRALKQVFDPNNIMNPGKIFD